MDHGRACVRAVGARRRCPGAVLLFGNGGALSTRFRRRTHSSPRADYYWPDVVGGRRYFCALRVVAESRSVEPLRARAHEICLRSRGHAGVAVPAYSTDDAVVVHRLYRTLLAAGRDVDRILRRGDERCAATTTVAGPGPTPRT